MIIGSVPAFRLLNSEESSMFGNRCFQRREKLGSNVPKPANLLAAKGQLKKNCVGFTVGD